MTAADVKQIQDAANDIREQVASLNRKTPAWWHIAILVILVSTIVGVAVGIGCSTQNAVQASEVEDLKRQIKTLEDTIGVQSFILAIVGTDDQAEKIRIAKDMERYMRENNIKWNPQLKNSEPK